MCTAVVEGGEWGCVSVSVDIGEHTIVASQTADAGRGVVSLADSESAPVTLAVTLAVAVAVAVAPVTVVAPGEGSSVGTRPTFSGAGQPAATVTATYPGGTLGSATVAGNGTWSLTSAISLPLVAVAVTVTQDVDGSSATVLLNVVAATPSPGAGAGILPATGLDPTSAAVASGVAGLLLLAGAMLLRRERRRAAVRSAAR